VNNEVRMGGNLIENTTITQGSYNLNYNLNGSGDFEIQDNGQSAVIVENNGNVGIGNAAPSTFFHYQNSGISGSWQVRWENSNSDDGLMRVRNTNAGNGARVLMGVTNYNGTSLVATGVIGLSLNTNSGTIGRGVIGTANTYEGVGVEGSRYNDGGSDDGWGGVFYNGLGYTGSFGTASDRQLKKSINSINSAVDRLKKVRGVRYQHKIKEYPNMGLGEGEQYGFVAQELEKEFPQLVQEKVFNTQAASKKEPDMKAKADHEKFKTVNYPELIPVLVEAIKEQQKEIDMLKKKVNNLQEE